MLRSTAATLAASLLASGCVIVPVTVESYDPDCRLVTHHMELQTTQVNSMVQCSGSGCNQLLAAFGVSAASVIVSGSIVVIGNVVYWAEERAGCEAPSKPSGPVVATP